jgi:M6 family metalloprotease-like protein
LNPSPAPIPDAWRILPSTGTPKVLALLISFADYPQTVPSSTVQSMLFGDGNASNFPLESLRRYYERSSYGQLSIRGDVLGWYAAANRSTVAETTQGREALIKEALDSYEAAGHDFAQYDNDGDGIIDYLIVMWTGPAGAWASFWWGYKTDWQDSAYQLDGKRLGGYSWQWEASSPTVVIHETGHALGLPDYYDYDGTKGPKGGLGGLDMMDANTGDHNCFSKFLLGWLKPTPVGGGSSTLSLPPESVAQDCLLVTPTCATSSDAVAAFSEYFLVENRSRVNTANDKNMPGDGFLIWHIDSQLDPGTGYFAFDNSYTSHKLIRVMEADGLEEIESGGRGDAGDYWSGALTFSGGSVPSCTFYDGLSCPFEMTNMSMTGDPMSLDVSYPVASAVFCDSRRWVEVDPMCAIVDCSLQRPGENVVNPDPTSLERVDRGSPIIETALSSQISGVSVTASTVNTKISKGQQIMTH